MIQLVGYPAQNPIITVPTPLSECNAGVQAAFKSLMTLADVIQDTDAAAVAALQALATEYLTNFNGPNELIKLTGAGAIPSSLIGGSNTQVQYNNAGTLSGAAGLTYNCAQCSLAEGSSNAAGACSHAEGQSQACGNISHAEGLWYLCKRGRRPRRGLLFPGHW